VRLAPSQAGGTDLTYDADAAVGGVIGGVGQRMLSGVTKKMAGQFFSAVDADISGARPAAPAPSAPAGVPATTAPGMPAGAVTRQPAGAGTVYAGRSAPAEASRVRDYALGVLTGGGIALLGVLVGWAIGRG
jgi:hypothetical protein